MYDRPDISHDPERPARMTDVLKRIRDEKNRLVVLVNVHSPNRDHVVQAFVCFDTAPRVGDILRMEDNQPCQVYGVYHRLQTVRTDDNELYTCANYVIAAVFLGKDEAEEKFGGPMPNQVFDT